MARKNFKKSARESVASAFFTVEEPVKATVDKDIEDTKDIEETAPQEILPKTPVKKAPPKKTGGIPKKSDESTSIAVDLELPPYRINLKLKGEYKEYLDQVSWENRTSITQYLNDLILQDQKRYEGRS